MSVTLSTARCTEKVITFITTFSGENLPAEAVNNAKIGISDTLGVGIAGMDEEVSKILQDYVKSKNAPGEASIWGTKDKVGISDAAMVNGTMAHALDFDDCNRAELGHPSTVLVPAIFAISEVSKATGRKVLEAYIVGFEVIAKLGRVINPGLYDKGWHPTSVLGIVGACASVSYLLDLNPEQVRSALGIAASEASGIKKNFGSMTKPFHAGSASAKGLQAALLAKKGLTADYQALDGEFGYLNIFKGDKDHALDQISNIGNPLEIIESGLVIKQYPSCASFHPLLDGIIDLSISGSIDPQQIKEIECKLNPSRIPHIDKPVVKNGLEGKFSLQYSLAVSLIDGENTLKQYKDDSVNRPEVQAIMPKITIVEESNYTGYTSELIIHMKDGQRITRLMNDTKGSPALPLSESELFHKFRNCISMKLDPSVPEKLWSNIMKLEKLKSLEEILLILSP